MRRLPFGPIAALLTVVLFASVLALQGCSKTSTTGDSTGSTKDATDTGSTDEATATTPPTEGETMSALIKTSKGDIKMTFYPEDAPKTVESFVKLSKEGFYDGIRFHRVEPGFVVQGGDPQTKGLSAEEVQAIIARQKSGQYQQGDPALGTGGPGFNLKAEFNSRKHLEGTLAMARSQSPDSAGSQFYICLAPQPFLDGKYTVFGQVTEGMDVVKALGVGDEIVAIEIDE